MSKGWREFLNQPRAITGTPVPLAPTPSYTAPASEEAAVESRAGTRSTPERLKREYMDALGIRVAVLAHDSVMFTPSLTNHYLSAEICRAVNDWCIERWLDEDGDKRLYANLLVPNQLPEVAAKEIRRVGNHPRIIGVLMAANGLGKPLGHPLYHPVYAACAELGLAVTIVGGGDSIPETLTHTTGGGLPATYSEYALLASHPIMIHLSSLIAQGVFETHPRLQVLIAGVGIGWLPFFLWRIDTVFKTYRTETPWLKRLPSEYFRDHVRIGTYPSDGPSDPESFQVLLGALDQLDELVCFASGYPSAESSTPQDVAARFSSLSGANVFHENALSLFAGKMAVPA